MCRMTSRTCFLLLFLVVQGAGAVHAQVHDSIPTRTDSIQVYYFYSSRIDSTLSRNAHWWDTAFHAAQNYDPLLLSETFSQTAGNIGLAHRNMYFSKPSNSGFDPGYHHIDGYTLNSENIRYYHTLLPFTDLKYVTGSRKEQYFHVIHSHNIKRQVTIAANFRIINAFGRRSFRQKADNINTSFTAYYTTRKQRYGVFTHYYYNRSKNMENGGLLVDSTYEQYREGLNFTQFAYGLFNALNTFKENAWQVKQFVNLDFRRADSTAGKLRGFSMGRFTLTSTYQKPRYYYEDQDASSGYYNAIYYDSTAADDSSYTKQLHNSLNWCSNEFNARGKPSVMRLFAGIKHSYIEVHEAPLAFYLSQFRYSGGLQLNLHNGFRAEISGDYLTGDYNAGDLSAGMNASYGLGDGAKKGTLSVFGRFARTEASWVARHIENNYYRWYHNFGKQQKTEAGLSYIYKRLQTRIHWQQWSHMVFFNEASLPQQDFGKAANVIALTAKKDFVFGKVRVDNTLLMQYTDRDDIIRVPLLVASQAWYVTFDMFKKALKVQTGIEAWYNTPYYADAWNPATRQFHLQNERKTGNYVYIDVFLNLKIKRAVLFLALDHVNSGLMGYKYYTTLHYPAPDRAFKFGVSWMFHD